MAPVRALVRAEGRGPGAAPLRPRGTPAPLLRERVLYWQPTGPNPPCHRDD